MKSVVIFFVIALVLALSASVDARTWYVPSGECPTIQAGIDSASAGDIVQVADGTYIGPGNKNLDFGGKAITVRSENGPDNCIIDCQDDGRGFYFHSGETDASVVNGFTITAGMVARGAGIYCESSSPTMANCTISGNAASERGGGVYCQWEASPRITNCTITDNNATMGGGIYCYWNGTDPTISGCTIRGNTADTGGGIELHVDASPTIVNCTIKDNSVTDRGGGIGCFSGGCSPTIMNCRLVGNHAGNAGGAFYCHALGANPTSYPVIVNCTVSRNSADQGGGGISCYWNTHPTISNCIFWDDTAPNGAEIHLISSSYPSTLTVSYSDVEGGQSAAYVESGCTLNWEDGNIDADPRFVHPDNDNYHLWGISPCIDAADNTAVPPDEADLDKDGDTSERTPRDLDYNRRFVDNPTTLDTGVPDPPDYPEIVDMGAYEFQDTPAIPTFSEWGLIILVMLLVLSAWAVLRRRKAVVSRQ